MLQMISQKDIECYQYCSERLKLNKEFIKQAMQIGKINSFCIGKFYGDLVFLDSSIIGFLPDEIKEDKKFMLELEKIEKERKEKNENKHNIEEIEDAVSDRKLEDVNKVVAEISEEMKDKSKENEPTKGN